MAIKEICPKLVSKNVELTNHTDEAVQYCKTGAVAKSRQRRDNHNKEELKITYGFYNFNTPQYFKLVPLYEISCIQASGDFSIVLNNSKLKFLSNFTMNRWEKVLPEKY